MNADGSYLLLAKADYGNGYTILLYRTAGGKYFACERTCWGNTERIMTLKRDQAVKTFQEFPVHMTDFDVAFPLGELVASG